MLFIVFSLFIDVTFTFTFTPPITNNHLYLIFIYFYYNSSYFPCSLNFSPISIHCLIIITTIPLLHQVRSLQLFSSCAGRTSLSWFTLTLICINMMSITDIDDMIAIYIIGVMFIVFSWVSFSVRVSILG